MDVIILIFLIYYIGKQARQKGMNVLRWRVRLGTRWIGAEILIGLSSYFITHSMQAAGLSGILAAVLLAVITFQQFRKAAEQQPKGEEQNADDVSSY